MVTLKVKRCVLGVHKFTLSQCKFKLSMLQLPKRDDVATWTQWEIPLGALKRDGTVEWKCGGSQSAFHWL